MKKNIRRARACAAAVCVLFFLSGGIARAADEQPNVLFIAIDDLKPLLGCYGDEFAQSPTIDRIAEGGTVFLNAHCQQAVCGPSRASLLTGLRPDKTKVWDLNTKIRKINPTVVMLPQHFKINGYETAAMGKIFDPRSVTGEQRTDDPDSWSIPYTPEWELPYSKKHPKPQLAAYQSEAAHALAKKAEVEGVRDYDPLKKYFVANDAWLAVESADVPDDAYTDGAITGRALELMERMAKGDKPFFLAVGYKKPHLPFVAPTKYWDLYDRDQIKLHPFQEKAEDSPDMAYHNSDELRSYSVQFESDGSLDESVQRELIHGYYACVSYIDAQIDILLKKLEELGLAENTVIVVWGDHGWHLGDHGLWCKHTNFEQATRSPLIISAPGFTPAQRHSGPVEFVDIYPTLCDLAGLPLLDALQGDSLVPALKDPSVSVKPYAVSQWPRGGCMGYAIRTDRYRYVAWVEKSGKNDIATDLSGLKAEELYDYETDPMETVSQIKNSEYKNVLKTLRGQMETFLANQ